MMSLRRPCRLVRGDASIQAARSRMIRQDAVDGEPASGSKKHPAESSKMKSIAILGTRGIPAQHGGFETFAEYLALYLVRRGWQVTVYCQEDGQPTPARIDTWEGVERITIPVSQAGAIGTMVFDWKTIIHALQRPPTPLLTLGYNTAAFCLALRLGKRVNLINMDGIEWRRDKWTFAQRAWLWLNERCGCWFGSHLVADHPRIADHLATRVARNKTTMIPYGAPAILNADASKLSPLGLEPGSFATVIARPEPENSVLQIVRAFSRKQRGFKLVMLGNYNPEKEPFHRQVLDAASSEVIFPGAIYDKATVESLRFHGRLYIHGHRVGGTNPSLVEALGAGSPVLAHDNHFNRWVAGEGASYFKDEDECSIQLDNLLSDDHRLMRMSLASRARHKEAFTWDNVLAQYETLLTAWQ